MGTIFCALFLVLLFFPCYFVQGANVELTYSDTFNGSQCNISASFDENVLETIAKPENVLRNRYNSGKLQLNTLSIFNLSCCELNLYNSSLCANCSVVFNVTSTCVTAAELSIAKWVEIALILVVTIIFCFIFGGVVHLLVRRGYVRCLCKSSTSRQNSKIGPPYYKHIHRPKPVSPPINRLSRPISSPPAIDMERIVNIPPGTPTHIVEVAHEYESPRSRAFTDLEDQRRHNEERLSLSTPLIDQSLPYDVPTSLPVYDELIEENV